MSYWLLSLHWSNLSWLLCWHLLALEVRLRLRLLLMLLKVEFELELFATYLYWSLMSAEGILLLGLSGSEGVGLRDSTLGLPEWILSLSLVWIWLLILELVIVVFVHFYSEMIYYFPIHIIFS